MRLSHPDPISGADYSAVELSPDNATVIVMDQRQLPREEHYEELRDVEEVFQAIRELWVRGAPAIGVTAAYGMVIAARQPGDFADNLAQAKRRLSQARPTAVNLFWALDEMFRFGLEMDESDTHSRVARMAEKARAIHRADVEGNRRLGRMGGERIPDGACVLTHCNAGALATGGYGTALGVIRGAVDAGKKIRVLADETRPVWQGARITAWELARDGIDVSVIVDGSAGSFFAKGEVDVVVVGADRIANNGDVANKIGTYSVACLARAHERKFFVAAPFSTVDMNCMSGEEIVIEERAAEEITQAGNQLLVPEGVAVRNPAFDVTPARLVSALFTDRGAADPLGSLTLKALRDAE